MAEPKLVLELAGRLREAGFPIRHLDLGGGLGVPVWIALPYACDWRWMLERTDSPWYPSVQLFRQNNIGEWGPVFANMAAELERLA